MRVCRGRAAYMSHQKRGLLFHCYYHPFVYVGVGISSCFILVFKNAFIHILCVIAKVIASTDFCLINIY